MTIVKMELARQLRRRRVLFFLALAAMPVALAVLWLMFMGQAQASEMLGRLEITLYLYLLVPFMSLFFGSGLISEEVRGQTLTYLLVRPVSRLTVIVSKFAAFGGLALIFVMGSLAVTVLVMWAGGAGTLTQLDPASPDRFAVVRSTFVTTAAGMFVYGAFFTALGVFLSKPAVPGVVILVLWEGIVSLSTGMLSKFTMLYYLRSLFGNMTDFVLPDIVHLESCSILRAALTMGIFGVACLAAGWWKLSRAEYRPND